MWNSLAQPPDVNNHLASETNPPRPADDGRQEDWLSRERVLALALLACTVLALYLCFLLMLPFLPALTWALAFAIVAHPLHQWVRRHVGHPGLAAGISVALVALVLIVPGALVARQLVVEASAFVERLEGQEHWLSTLEKIPWLSPWLSWLEDRIDLQQEAQRLAGLLAAEVGPLVTGSVEVIVQLLLTLFVLFFCFRDRSQALAAIRSWMPLGNSEVDRLFRRVADSVHATVFGTLVVALVQGVLGGLSFWWLGLPAPMLWGAIMAVLAVVPYLGAFVVWLPVAVYLALTGAWGSAIFLLLWGSIVVGLSDNVLYPIIVGKRLRTHTLPTFIAVVGGLAVFGVSGVILGPVVFAVTLALVEIWRRRTEENPADLAAVPG